MRKLVHSGVSLRALLLLVGAWHSSLAAQDTGTMVSYTLVSPSVTLHEPVFLRFEVNNGSREPIRFDLGQDRKQAFEFGITFPNGTVVAELSKPTREGFSQIGIVSLSVGETYTQTLLLNEWVDFSEVGTYQIEGRLANPIESHSGLRLPVTSFRAVISVLPRDESRLRQICENLAERIVTSSAVEDAADAAVALSYVRDPIAVPYLGVALQSGKYVEKQIVHGLEQIGDVSAVQVLVVAMKEAGNGPFDMSTRIGMRATLARAALARIERRSADLAIRQLIQQALNPPPSAQAEPQR